MEVTSSRWCSRRPTRDRKSTRLNSSHGYISYAVFCLKKKKKNEESDTSVTKTPLKGLDVSSDIDSVAQYSPSVTIISFTHNRDEQLEFVACDSHGGT